MTVDTNTKKDTYSGDGSTTSFAFTFPVQAQGEILVQIKDTNGTVTDQTITTHYTVSGTLPGTGNVVFVTAPVSTDTVILKRAMGGTQDTDFIEKGALAVDNVEQALDELTMHTLQNEETSDRCMKVDSAVDLSTVDMTLPTPSASKYIRWNSTATAFEYTASSAGSGIDNVVEDTTPQLGGNLDLNSNSIVTTANGDIDLAPNGTGVVKISGTSSSAAEIRLLEDSDNGTNYFGIKAPAALTASTTFTLPDGDGSANQVLETDGAGTLSWVANSGSGIANVVDDTTPQLGGNLDMNGQDIVTTANADIDLAPNGTGAVVIKGNSTQSGILRLTEDTDNGTNYIGFKPPAAVTSSIDFELPNGDGTANQVLTTDGAGTLSWATGSSAGTTIHLASATASTSAEITFESNIDSTYKRYLIRGRNILPASDAVEFWCRTGTGGGPTYNSGASDYKWDVTGAAAGSAFDDSDTADSEITLSSTSAGKKLSNAAGEGFNFDLIMIDPAEASFNKVLYGVASYINQSSNASISQFIGVRSATTALTAVKFLMSSGNIAQGEFDLYGLKES